MIETLEELKALPAGSVVRDNLKGELFRMSTGSWMTPKGLRFSHIFVNLPATVMYKPTE